jgi:hypothetical protein
MELIIFVVVCSGALARLFFFCWFLFLLVGVFVVFVAVLRSSFEP